MIIIHHRSENVNTWNGVPLDEATCFDDPCPSCGSRDSFSPGRVGSRWIWTAQLPQDWTGDLEGVSLEQVQIAIPTILCGECGVIITIMPTFLVRGTRLAVEAIAVVGLLYEKSKITWRALAEALTGGVIAHSTLYRSVHAFGATPEVQAIARTLEQKTESWGQPKSVQAGPRKREGVVRAFFSLLVTGAAFCRAKWQLFMERMHVLARTKIKQIKPLYSPRK